VFVDVDEQLRQRHLRRKRKASNVFISDKEVEERELPDDEIEAVRTQSNIQQGERQVQESEMKTRSDDTSSIKLSTEEKEVEDKATQKREVEKESNDAQSNKLTKKQVVRTAKRLQGNVATAATSRKRRRVAVDAEKDDEKEREETSQSAPSEDINDGEATNDHQTNAHTDPRKTGQKRRKESSGTNEEREDSDRSTSQHENPANSSSESFHFNDGHGSVKTSVKAVSTNITQQQSQIDKENNGLRSFDPLSEPTSRSLPPYRAEQRAILDTGHQQVHSHRDAEVVIMEIERQTDTTSQEKERETERDRNKGKEKEIETEHEVEKEKEEEPFVQREVIVNRKHLKEVSKMLVSRTEGFTVDSLHALHARIYQLIYQHRQEYDKNALLQVRGVFLGVYLF
jgi:hypothetical protein